MAFLFIYNLWYYMKKIIIKLLPILILLCLSSTNISISADNHQINTNQEYDFVYDYYNYSEMTDLLVQTKEKYPNIMNFSSIGISYEGRDIWVVKISDNVELNEDEPGVLLIGSLHGDEKPPFESLIYFIKHICEYSVKENTDDDNDGLINEDPIDGVDNDNDDKIDEDPSEERVKNIIDNTEIFIIPMANPDGVEYISGQYNGWRKNRNPKTGQKNIIGVDLNRNFGFKWILYNIFPFKYRNFWTSYPDSWNYRGEEPFSEIESTSIRNFIESEDIKVSLSYHSYGEIIMYPWTHTSQKTPDENLFIKIADGMSKINGYYVYNGRSTFLPWPGGTIGTSENWLYGIHGILSYTMELCKSKAPTNPDVILDCCIKHVGVNLYICEQAPAINTKKYGIKSFTNPLLRSYLN